MSYIYVYISIALIFLGLAQSSPALAVPESMRLVTLGGAVTETVCDLGFCDAIVGSDESSIFPESVLKKARVGYFRSVSTEGVLSLKPTLVVATEQMEPKVAIEQIRAAGVRLVLVPDDKTIDGTKRRITEIAQLLGEQDLGTKRVEDIDKAIEKVRISSGKVTAKPRVLFVYARGAKHLQVAGEGTAATELIALAGGESAGKGFQGYKPMTSEAVVSANPDVILMTTSGVSSIGEKDKILGLPGVKLTKAGRTANIVTMDDLLLLGFGPRVGTAVFELFALLHPAAAKKADDGL
jgi:iron complex transport system substrate-binding protein